MDKIFKTLNSGESVLINQSDLPEFTKFVSKQKDYYSFRYEYFETMVQITMTGKETIIRIGEKLH